MTDLVDEQLDRWKHCKSQRQTLETVWEELADLFRPSRSGFTSQRSPGDNRQARIYDGEQIERAGAFANFCENGLVPTGEKWLEIATDDQIEVDDDDAAEWLTESGDVLLDEITEQESGFQNAVAVMIQDFVVFGAGAMFVSQRSNFSSFLFRTVHLRDVHWYRDEAGLPECVYNRMLLRPEDAAKRFGKENLSTDTQKALADDKSGKLPKIEFVEVVAPRYARTVGSPNAKDMPWGAYLIEVKAKHLVRESGYPDMPWLIPEWEVMDGDDIWSPGRRALPDVRQLQSMAKTILRGAQRQVSPPWMAASDGIFGRINLTPDAVNYFDASAVAKLQGRVNLIEPLLTGGDMHLGLDLLDAQRQKITRLFYGDVIRLPDKPGMTATEILRLNADLVRLLGGPFGRLETNFAQPLAKRTFGLLMAESVALRFGVGSPFKPLPQSLMGRSVNFKFASELSRAREAAKTASISNYLEAMLPLLPMKPELLDNVDLDEMIRNYTAKSLAPRYVVAKDKVQMLRQARQQQALQQQQMDQMHQAAQAAGHAAPMVKALTDQRQAA